MIQPVQWHIPRHSANPDVVISQPCTANFLKKQKDLLPITKRIQEWRKSTNIHAIGTKGEEMTRDTIQLTNKNTQVFCPFRHSSKFFISYHHLFHSKTEPPILIHGRDIIHPVGKWNNLRVGQIFGVFFKTTVQITDMRDGLTDDFTIKF